MQKKQKTALRPTKPIRIKKRGSPKVVAARKTIHRNRPIHKRVALQPVTVLLLMCIGVLLCALTLRVLADTVTTTATVPAPPLTQPAVITYPPDGYQTNTQAITVSGTCPDKSYVDLSDNSIFVGTAVCTSNTYRISLDLTPGTNQLQAQDYNITNTPGPQSPPVTVTYIPPVAPPSGGSSTSPVATPTQLEVTQVDLSIPFVSVLQTPNVSDQPTLAGIAPPGSLITISMHPGLHICTAYATTQGYWSCKMPSTLAVGTYAVDVSARTAQGVALIFPEFKIHAIAAVPPQLSLPPLFHITSRYLYSEEAVGQRVSYTLEITGGRAPYAFTIDWGDGVTSTIVKQSEDSFTISHAYGWVNASTLSRIIKIQAIDTSGQSSTLQLDTLVRNPLFGSFIGTTTKPSWMQQFFNALRPWLWLIWPGYIIVLLLIFSFWLGEREELLILMKQKPARNRQVHAHGRH